MTAPSYIAAQALATLVNAAWQGGQQMPTCAAALSPSVSPATGAETVPAAYAIPVQHDTERASRAAFSNTMTVALILVMAAETEADAVEWLGMMDVAIRHVLAEGRQVDVAFIRAASAVLYDSELLANAGIFRAQVNFECLSHSPLREDT